MSFKSLSIVFGFRHLHVVENNKQVSRRDVYIKLDPLGRLTDADDAATKAAKGSEAGGQTGRRERS